MQRPVFCANWKMNHGPTEARAYMASFLGIFSPRNDRTIAMFPPALSVTAAREARGDRTDILLGIQNIYTDEKGAFTGESSAPMAADAGALLTLVGHSERRHVFGETDEAVAKKCAIAARFGLAPVLCVGETLAERKSGDTDTVVVRQLRAGLSLLTASQLRTSIIAYEPVWAIGTGHSATPADASHVHRRIRDLLCELAPTAAGEIPILYGGSVNRQNVDALLEAPEIDGVLVGGACLDPESWAAICRT
ncbi:MAG TPA: triose-phosphate isomerase [Gemmatimonadaceae bacterium]|nr:triose-phosphate isomerase [Gemmatimonadaceae bacterium]